MSSGKQSKTEILIVGGGVGGCAAAMSACAMGLKVIMTEETDWIGGQLTSQAVPPDEHSWIEQFGCTTRYRTYRTQVRNYYKDHYPLLPQYRRDPFLNPGYGFVSRLCHEPRVAHAVLEQMLAFYRAAGYLQIRLRHKAVQASADQDRIKSVKFVHSETKREEWIEADNVIDATELGDLLPLSGTEYVTGFESQKDTGEPSALPGDPEPGNIQAFTWVLAMGYDKGGNHVIDKPASYDFWKNYIPEVDPPWGDKLMTWNRPMILNNVRTTEPRYLLQEEADDPRKGLMNFRRIVHKKYYPEGMVPNEVTMVIWSQNDYFRKSIIDVSEQEKQAGLDDSRQQSLSLLYWIQTEAPRPDGGVGYPGAYPVPEAVGTMDGLAKAPYIREARRIKALFTVTENHIAASVRGHKGAEQFPDSVGVGLYHIDLHASTGGNNSIHLDCSPFQIPMGALIPIRMENLLAGCKNLGVTHLTNGAFRLHPVEWNVGESAGLLAAYCCKKKTPPRKVWETETLRKDFQTLCLAHGIELAWPKILEEDYWGAFDKRVMEKAPFGAIPR